MTLKETQRGDDAFFHVLSCVSASVRVSVNESTENPKGVDAGSQREATGSRWEAAGSLQEACGEPARSLREAAHLGGVRLGKVGLSRLEREEERAARPLRLEQLLGRVRVRCLAVLQPLRIVTVL